MSWGFAGVNNEASKGGSIWCRNGSGVLPWEKVPRYLKDKWKQKLKNGTRLDEAGLLPKLIMKRIVLIFLAAVSCKTASVSLEEGFVQRADFYPVEGKNGCQVNQVLKFGPFETTTIDRSMTFSYHVPLLVDFSGGKESLAFSIFDKQKETGVSFLGDSRMKDVHMSAAKGYFQVPIQQKDVFAGALIFSQPALKRYDFFLLNPNDKQRNAKCEGVVLKDGKEHLVIKGITKLQGSRLPQTQVSGYEFYQGDKVVATVDILNKGAVWMDNSLEQDGRMLIAGLSAALLVRSNLQEAVENL